MAEKSPETEGALRRLRRRLWIERIALLLVAGAFAALYFGAVPGGRRVTMIAVDGEPAAVLATQADAERILQEIKATVDLPPEEVTFAQNVTFHRVSAVANPVDSDREAMKSLADALDLRVSAAAILANGELVLALPTEGEAVRALSMLLHRFSPEVATSAAYFKERVRVETREVPPELLVASADAAVKRIVDEAAPRRAHEVEAGESAWQIARDRGVTLTRLQHANPGADLERLHVGQKLKIPGTLPPLTVVARREIEERVGEGPSARTRKVRITYENGMEVKREVIGRQVRRRPPQTEREREVPPAPDTSAPEQPWRWRDEVRE